MVGREGATIRAPPPTTFSKEFPVRRQGGGDVEKTFRQAIAVLSEECNSRKAAEAHRRLAELGGTDSDENDVEQR